jgi:phosphatidyl-myo-inositol alpha-mannosyltransferase
VRIALACPYAWDAPGGVQVHVRQLAEQLGRRGHSTLVLAPAWSSRQPEGVAVIARPVRLRFNGSVAPIAPDPRAIPRIRQELQRFGPDVVHVHEPFSPSIGMYAALAAGSGERRAGVAATFHSYAERSIALAAFSPLLRLVWNRLDVRLAVSGAAASFAGRHFANGLRIVPNGVDIDRFAGATPATGLPDGERILFVGRLEPRKGFRHALRAFAAVAGRSPRAVLVVAGEGPEGRALSELSPAVRDRVVMLGAVPYAELPRYHAAADVFVAPNTGGESFGIVLAEAMAAGLPVVASDIPGFREVVRQDVEGLLAPPGDAAALATALTRVLEDRGLRQRLGDAGRAKAERYRWERVAGEVEEAYGLAVQRGGVARPR